MRIIIRPKPMYVYTPMKACLVIFSFFLFADSTTTSYGTEPSYNCPMIDCVRPCPDSMYMVDEYECQTCDCECPLVSCLPCRNRPNIYAIDEYGCQTCDCVNSASSHITSSAMIVLAGTIAKRIME